jgi:hypothetical protein
MNNNEATDKPIVLDHSVIRLAPLILLFFVIALSPLGTAFYGAFTR